MPHGLSAPLPQDLQCLLSRLQDDAYQSVTDLCDRARMGITGLQKQTHEILVYTVLCADLIGEVSDYLRLRRLVLLPYIDDLLEKEEDGHDCKACGGGCSLNHGARIREMQAAHAGIQKHINKLHGAEWPIGEASSYPDAYRTLRADMLLLEEALMEIIFVEESALIPMLEDLQKKIGAHG